MLTPLALLAGCAVRGPCVYELKERGWRPIEAPPAGLDHREALRDWYWFTNDSGDFLACLERASRSACDGGYVSYRKEQDFKEEVIVCTT